MTDREQKIMEIREGYKSERDDNFTYKKEIVEQDIRFLLSELDRKDEENRKLREERDDAREQAQKYYRKFEDEVAEILRLQDELRSAQQEIERLRKELSELCPIADMPVIESLRVEMNHMREERDKMIEWLRMCLFNHGCWREEDYVAYMRNILKEIGVTVE